jgi:hypothetical protein
MALIEQLIGGANGAGQWAPGMPNPTLSFGPTMPGGMGGGLSRMGAMMQNRQQMPPTAG